MEILTYAKKAKMYNGQYAFITVDFDEEQEEWREENWFTDINVVQGTLNIGVEPAFEGLGPTEYKKFTDGLTLILRESPFNYDTKGNNVTVSELSVNR